ncbi:MAG: MFS transporter, partial [Chloroflexota bacterium]
ITGVIMLLITPLIALVLSPSGPAFPNNYAILFGAAGLLFACSIPLGMMFHELPGGKAVEKLPALSEFLPHLGRLLRDDRPFRSYIIVRMFTNLFLMAAPFYVVYATGTLGLSSDVAVPVLLAMQTVGGVVGALAYTWLGARNNLLVIQLSLGGSALLPICALLAHRLGPVPLYVGFLLYGVSLNSLNSGFQHWIVSYGHADQRPIYVGLSNTLLALISLIAPIIGGVIAQYLGYEPLFVVALFMTTAALLVTLRYMKTPREAVKAEIAAGD